MSNISIPVATAGHTEDRGFGKVFIPKGMTYDSAGGISGLSNEDIFRNYGSTHVEAIPLSIGAGTWQSLRNLSGLSQPFVFSNVPILPNTGRWYVEIKLTGGNTYMLLGTTTDITAASHSATLKAAPSLYNEVIGTIIGLVIDTDTGKAEYYRNGSTTAVTADSYSSWNYTQAATQYLRTSCGGGGGSTAFEGRFREEDFWYSAATYSAKAFNLLTATV